MTFKKGDQVRCVNSGPIGGINRAEGLTQGEVYTVKSQTSDRNVWLEKPDRGYFPERFELVQAKVPKVVARKNRSDVRPGPKTL